MLVKKNTYHINASVISTDYAQKCLLFVKIPAIAKTLIALQQQFHRPACACMQTDEIFS